MTNSLSKKEEKISRIFRFVLHSYEIAAKIEFVNFISEYYQVHSVQSYIYIYVIGFTVIYLNLTVY